MRYTGNVKGRRLWCSQVALRRILSIELPASVDAIDALASALGLRLPDEYRALLAEANGVSANLVQIYPAQVVPERNTTYEVAKYSPGYFVIGTVIKRWLSRPRHRTDRRLTRRFATLWPPKHGPALPLGSRTIRDEAQGVEIRCVSAR